MFILPIVSGALLLFSCIYHLITVYCAQLWRRSSRHSSSNSTLPPITILKPIRGTDPQQYASFETFCNQEHSEYQIVFGALDPADPGLDSARKLQAAYPNADIEIVTGGAPYGLNRKVCNLTYMLPQAKHELLVLCDSDMRVSPDYLKQVAEPFGDTEVGLVTCPYRGFNAKGTASSLEALGIGTDFIPSVFVAYYLWGVRPAFGSTIALTKSTLGEIGGFEKIVDELADDYKLAELVDATGKQVVLSGCVVDDVLGHESFSEMWSRRLRWAKTARSMRPGPYTGAFITFTTPLAILVVIASGFCAMGWTLSACALLLRIICATLISKRFTSDANLPRLLPLVPLSDILSFTIWIASFFGSAIMWRGEQFRLLRGGKLQKR